MPEAPVRDRHHDGIDRWAVRSPALRDAATQDVVNAGEGACGEPQPEQMPSPLWLGKVLERLAGVKDLGVRDQLDVAGLELHLQVEGGVIGDGLDEVECLQLRSGEPRSLRVALRVPNGACQPLRDRKFG